MAVKQFYLLGDETSTAFDVDISTANDIVSLQLLIAGHFAIVEPSGETAELLLDGSWAKQNLGIAFQLNESPLTDVGDIKKTNETIAVTIDGHAVREVPGPKGMPFVG